MTVLLLLLLLVTRQDITPTTAIEDRYYQYASEIEQSMDQTAASLSKMKDDWEKRLADAKRGTVDRRVNSPTVGRNGRTVFPSKEAKKDRVDEYTAKIASLENEIEKHTSRSFIPVGRYIRFPLKIGSYGFLHAPKVVHVIDDQTVEVQLYSLTPDNNGIAQGRYVNPTVILRGYPTANAVDGQDFDEGKTKMVEVLTTEKLPDGRTLMVAQAVDLKKVHQEIRDRAAKRKELEKKLEGDSAKR